MLSIHRDRKPSLSQMVRLNPEGDPHRLCFSKEFDRLHLPLPSCCAMACSDHIKGRVEDKTGGSTARKSRVTVVVCKLGVVRRYCQRLVSLGSALIHQHAVMNNLSATHRSKHYFGISELRLLFEALLLRLRKLPWWKKNYLAWALSLMTGIRPGSIRVSRHLSVFNTTQLPQSYQSSRVPQGQTIKNCTLQIQSTRQT